MKPIMLKNQWNAALLLTVLAATGGAYAQNATLSDAQIQANVLRAMAKEPTLASQQITASTTFGTVTLTGSVTNNAARDLADRVTSTTVGVKKVVDQLSVGGSAAAGNTSTDQRGSTVIPPPAVAETGPPADQPQAEQQQQQAQMDDDDESQLANMDDSQQQQQMAPSQQRPAYVSNNAQQQAYPSVRNNGGGIPVVVPAGTTVNVRMLRWLSSGQVQPGSTFEGFVAQDVVSGGQIAVPRGTTVQGTVIDVQHPGALSGSGSITLQLQSATIGGNVYQLQSDPWTINGHDKTGRTVGNTVVTGLFGALIGGAFGGGAGALIGAGAGAGAGLGMSAAQGGGNAVIPSEAMVDFQLTAPVKVVTVSDTELARLNQYAGPAQPARPAYAGPRYVYPTPYPYAYPYPYYGYPYGYAPIGRWGGYYGRPYPYRYYGGGYYRRY